MDDKERRLKDVGMFYIGTYTCPRAREGVSRPGVMDDKERQPKDVGMFYIGTYTCPRAREGVSGPGVMDSKERRPTGNALASSPRGREPVRITFKHHDMGSIAPLWYHPQRFEIRYIT